MRSVGLQLPVEQVCLLLNTMGKDQLPESVIQSEIPSYSICNKEQTNSPNVLQTSIHLEIESDPKINENIYKGRGYWTIDIIIAIITFTTFGLIEGGIIPSPKSGFICGDVKLSHKFKGDTISGELLITGSIVFPFILIYIVELIVSECKIKNENEDISNVLKKSWLTSLKRTLFWYYHYVLGLCIVLAITSVIKVIMGEPRPHFFDSCRPDTGFNCIPGTFIETYKCTNKEWSNWFLRDVSKSFPSGHTSASIYTSLFIVVFLQKQLYIGQSWLLLPWLQLVSCLWGLVCSLTRITDHRHHWWDVLAGFFLGILVASYTIKNMYQIYSISRKDSLDKETN